MEYIRTMSNQSKITEKEILEALNRSGYLFESQVVKQLDEYGFFVEPNQVALDPLTNKSREIDIVAEYYNSEDSQRMSSNKVFVKAKFVFEIKNNNSPIVLLTSMKS